MSRAGNGNENAQPVVSAPIKAHLLMPAMAGMSLQQPKTKAETVPGDYSATVLFPHNGEYRLDLNIAPQGEKAFTASFTLNVGAAGGHDMIYGDHHGMHDMPGMNGMDMMMEPVAGIAEMQEASGTSWQPAVTPMYGI